MRLHAHGGFGAVRLEKSEGVIGRGANAGLAFRAVSKQKGLQHIHDLRDVAHEQFVCVAVENIQPKSRGNGAAHGALHPKFSITLFVFLWNFVPHAPFVENQADFVAVTVTVEERSLFGDGIFHSLEYGELLADVVGAEFRGPVRAAFVVVHGNAAGSAAVKRVHETARPLAIVSVGSAGHEKRLGPAKFAKVHGELPVQSAVDLGTHPSAASPIFIADAPIAHSKGLGSAVLYAFFRKGAS